MNVDKGFFATTPQGTLEFSVAARRRLRAHQHADHAGAAVTGSRRADHTIATAPQSGCRGGGHGRRVARPAPYAFAGPLRYSGRWLAGDLSVVQWSHFIPAYNAWFRTWAVTWGEQNDVEVSVDFEPYTDLPALAATEVKEQRGHDIFGFLSPPARFEDQVIDHGAIVSEVEKVVGPLRRDREAKHVQPEDEEVLRRLGLSRSRAAHLASRRLELLGAVACDVGSRARSGSGAEGKRASDRNRTGERARLEPGADLLLDVLRLVPAGRVRTHSRSTASTRSRRSSSWPTCTRGVARARSSTGTRPRTTSSCSRAEGR